MIPTAPALRSKEQSIPRESGDDPPAGIFPSDEAAYSPRERG